MNRIWFHLCSVHSPSSGREARTPGAVWATVARDNTLPRSWTKVGMWLLFLKQMPHRSRRTGCKNTNKVLISTTQRRELFNVDGFSPQSLHILVLLVMILFRSTSHQPTDTWITVSKQKATEHASLTVPSPIAPCAPSPFRKTHRYICVKFFGCFSSLSITWIGHDKWDSPREQFDPQHYSIELSVMMEMFYISAVQYSRHQPHVAFEHLKRNVANYIKKLYF